MSRFAIFASRETALKIASKELRCFRVQADDPGLLPAACDELRGQGYELGEIWEVEDNLPPCGVRRASREEWI